MTHVQSKISQKTKFELRKLNIILLAETKNTFFNLDR